MARWDRYREVLDVGRGPSIMRELEEARKMGEPEREWSVQLARFYGYSWEEIGEVLGVNKQTAWRRYKHVAGKFGQRQGNPSRRERV